MKSTTTPLLWKQHLHKSGEFFSASGEDFMSNLIGINLRISEFAYAYMQSMSTPSFSSFHQSIVDNSSTNDFVQEEQPVVLDE
ncbi:hypothetical protein JHK85_050771 [Glycine max]|nr:hypothetical protein JHK85_050771 [Glycine max]